MYKLLLSFAVISDVKGPLFQREVCLLSAVLLISVDFKAPRALWKFGKSGKFHRSDGHCKHNGLEYWANFHRSRAWQIVLIFNTVVYYYNWNCHIDNHANYSCLVCTFGCLLQKYSHDTA